MNKDVIYIDVEDDITAIISKVKAAKEKIVALVPPKRVGVLQSAVNLRLLCRAAEQDKKRIVLITNNQALMSLAASAGIPVAKNLQSKPELAEVTALAVDDDDDIIDGNELPIGEHAKQSERDKKDSADDVVEAIAAAAIMATPPSAGESLKPAQPKKKAKVSVPNFNTFRKKMIIGIGAAIVLIGFIVWAAVIAPRATVVVAAKTKNQSVNTAVTIRSAATTDAKSGTLKATMATDSEDKKVEFTPTGQKNVGKKASGTVQFTNSGLSDQTISQGTHLTSKSGLVFILAETVTVPGASFPCGSIACPTEGSANGDVQAADQGAKYNAETGNLNGAPSNVSATFTDPTSGGTDKIVKVVTAGDVQKAKESLVKDTTDEKKAHLKDSFEKSVIPIEESYSSDYTDVTVTPEVGQEAESTQATLTSTVKYQMYGVDKSELDNFLKAFVKQNLDNADSQRIYESGSDKANFQDAKATKNGATATLIATAKIGPKLDEDEIKGIAKGQHFGDIQEKIQAIPGVENVDVKFFPFWLNTVPNDMKRISVEFKVDESN